MTKFYVTPELNQKESITLSLTEYEAKLIKYVDDVVVYQAEETFLSYLKDYEIRFLGTDYLDGSYTGKDIAIDVIWLDREGHDYSSTKLKTDIYNSVKEPMQRGYGYD